jgi:ABC-type transport system substrate-binding protein
MERNISAVLVFLVIGIFGVGSIAVIQQGSYTALDSEYQDLLSEYGTLEALYEQALEDYDTVYSQYLSKVTEYDQLNSTYTALLSTHYALMESVDEISQSLLDTTLELVALNQTYLDLLADFEALNVTYYILTGDYSALNATYQILLQQHSQLNTTYFSLLDSYGVLQDEYSFLNTTYYQLLSDQAILQADYDQLLLDFSVLQANYDTLLLDYTQLQADHDALQSDYDNLWLNYNTLWAAHQALQSNYDALQDEYNSLQSQYNQLQTEYESLEDDYLNLQTEYDILNASYWELRSEFPPPMTFVMAYPSDIGELNPMFYRSERSHWYAMLVYDTLISYDNNLEAIPWLAEGFEVTADGLSVIFTLRVGAVWHDGTPLTPNDVEFTFNYYKDAPPDAIAWSFMQHVSSIDVSGQDITVTFDQQFAFALQTLGGLYILPEHIRSGVAADDARWNDENNVIAHTGSGPFKFVERVPSEYTELTRNDDWWGASNPHVGQLPNIETVRIDVVVGQEARILAMQAGTVDSEKYEVFGPYVNMVLNAPELDLVTGVVSQWDYVIGFNMKVPGFDDLEVRKAICYAINREQLVDIGRLGYGTPTNSSIPYEFFPGFYHEDGVFYEYDVATANQILEDAGYVDTNWDGIREFPDGVTPMEFDLWVLSWDDISVATGTGVRLQLAEIGIDINVVIKDDATMYEGIYQELEQHNRLG